MSLLLPCAVGACSLVTMLPWLHGWLSGASRYALLGRSLLANSLIAKNLGVQFKLFQALDKDDDGNVGR